MREHALAGLAGLAARHVARPCFDRAVQYFYKQVSVGGRGKGQDCSAVEMPILPVLPGCPAARGVIIAGFRRGFQKLGAPCSYEGQLMTVALLQNRQLALGRERATLLRAAPVDGSQDAPDTLGRYLG